MLPAICSRPPLTPSLLSSPAKHRTASFSSPERYSGVRRPSASEKEESRVEIDREKALEALEKLDRQIESLAQKDAVPRNRPISSYPGLDASSDVKMGMRRREELAEIPTSFLAYSAGKKRRASRAVILSPPPSYLYSHPRTVVKSVNFTNDAPIIIIPPDSSQPVTLPKPRPAEVPAHRPATAASADTDTAAKESGRTRFQVPNRDRLATGPELDGSPPVAGPAQQEPGPAQRGPPHCYVMSPLPRWEDVPRRREYFSAEYNYYPTPIREGIYNIATDPNRLSTIFSEENPNACSIV